MAKRITGAQKPFKMLVANLRGASDPSRGENPVKVRSTYETQLFPEISGRGFETSNFSNNSNKTPGRSTRQGRIRETIIAPEFTITVSSAVVPITSAQTRIVMGDYTAIPGIDFVVVAADTTTTATNLATFIQNSIGWNATPAADVVTVELPSGLDYNNILLKSTGPASGNYTIQGYPIKGSPNIGPAIIG